MAYTKSIPFEYEGVAGVMMPHPAQGIPLFELTEQVMRTGECNLSPKEREWIAAFTSGLNDCTFCYNSHKTTALEFDVNEDLLTSMVADIESSDVDEKLKPIFLYVKKLTATPSRIVQADVDAIFAAGWNEVDFHYVVMICSLFNFYNRLMDGYGCENSAEFRTEIGQGLAKFGYDFGAWADYFKQREESK